MVQIPEKVYAKIFYIAENHKEGLEKLKILVKSNKHVFTTENEEKGSLNTKDMIRRMKEDKSNANLLKLGNIKQFDPPSDQDAADNGKHSFFKFFTMKK